MALRAVRTAGNARPRRRRTLERWRGWRRHHSQSAADSLAKVLHEPIASLMTWLVIGIAIALPAGLWVALDNLDRTVTRLDSPAQLALFLNGDTDADAARGLAADLGERGDIRAVLFLDRDDALAEFVERSGMGDLAAGLDNNPLPHQLLVTPRSEDPDTVAQLRDALLSLPDVDEILLDTAWLQRLQSLMALARRAVMLLAGLLLVAVILVLGNTIRLAIESRRDEIVIIKLVGGSDAFVRRPLLYTGLWYGLGGGAIGALMVLLGTLILAGPVASLAAAYGSDFTLRGLGLVDSLQLALLGALLGLLGAWSAVTRHLRDIQPR